jgi:hypothetical protein
MQTYEYILYMRIDIDVVFSLKRPLTHWGPDRTAPWRFNDHLREWHYQRLSDLATSRCRNGRNVSQGTWVKSPKGLLKTPKVNAFWRQSMANPKNYEDLWVGSWFLTNVHVQTRCTGGLPFVNPGSCESLEIYMRHTFDKN